MAKGVFDISQLEPCWLELEKSPLRLEPGIFARRKMGKLEKTDRNFSVDIGHGF